MLLLFVSLSTQPPIVVCKKQAQSEHVQYTSHARFFASLALICMLSRGLVTKFLHRTSVGSLLRVYCWLGTKSKKHSIHQSTTTHKKKEYWCASSAKNDFFLLSVRKRTTSNPYPSLFIQDKFISSQMRQFAGRKKRVGEGVENSSASDASCCHPGRGFFFGSSLFFHTHTQKHFPYFFFREGNKKCHYFPIYCFSFVLHLPYGSGGGGGG